MRRAAWMRKTARSVPASLTRPPLSRRRRPPRLVDRLVEEARQEAGRARPGTVPTVTGL